MCKKKFQHLRHTEGGASPKHDFQNIACCPEKAEEVFFVCARSRQGGNAGVEILSGGREMPALVDSTETCTSGLSREVY